MPFKTFSEFGRELTGAFNMHENCYDCAGFYDGCEGWRASRDFTCADFHRLPKVAPGTYGQRFPASRRSERAEYQPADTDIVAGGDTCVEVASLSHKIHRAKTRTCGCGAILPTGRRLCDICRTENRRKAKRDYMRTYMEQRRSAAVHSGSHMPFPATAMPSTQAEGDDLTLTGLWPRVPASGQTSVLTNGVLTGGRTWQRKTT